MGKWLLAVLLTHAADPHSDLVLIDPSGSTVVAGIDHVPDGSVHGRLWRGTTAMVVAERAPGDYGGELLRVEPGKPPVTLCDRVNRLATPLVADGRVFVERGRAGVQGDELRVDDLTIDEWTPRGMRTLWRGRGYSAHLAGAFANEILIYTPNPSATPLLAVDRDNGRVRTLAELRSPRDFRVSEGRLVFTQLIERQWTIDAIDLASGKLQRLFTGAGVLAPHPWNGDIAFNDHGLTLLGKGHIEHRPGDDVVLATSGEHAAMLHYPGPELEVFDGKVRQIATPTDSHVQVVGFVK
jgi:hypothetical protein